jgi:hypothetical protein
MHGGIVQQLARRVLQPNGETVWPDDEFGGDERDL